MIKEKAQALYKSRLRLKDIETAIQKLIRPMEEASNSEPHTATLASNFLDVKQERNTSLDSGHLPFKE